MHGNSRAHLAGGVAFVPTQCRAISTARLVARARANTRMQTQSHSQWRECVIQRHFSRADACFSIYLIHPYVIQFFYKFFKLNNTDLSDNLLATFLSITVTLFLSILIYRTIERPLNHKIKSYLKLK
jgi:hypothetical protein